MGSNAHERPRGDATKGEAAVDWAQEYSAGLWPARCGAPPRPEAWNAATGPRWWPAGPRSTAGCGTVDGTSTDGPRPPCRNARCAKNPPCASPRRGRDSMWDWSG